MTDKTKEDFLKPFFMQGVIGTSPWPSYDTIQGRPEEIGIAMQAFADQEKRKTALEFLDWALTKNSQFDYVDEDFYWKEDKDGDMPLTDEELYDLYLQSLQPNTHK